MANFINKYQNQSAYEADSTKQYPNVSLVNGTVEYAATAPSYVFTTSSQTTQNINSDTTTVTLSVTSTKNGNAIGYTGSTNDAWITNIASNNGTVTVTIATNSGSARNGSVTLTQNESGNTLTFTIAQAAPIVDDSNVTYVVNAPSTMTTKIFGSNYDDENGMVVLAEPSTLVDYIKVDGESVNLTTLYSNDNEYQLTQGQHTIKYKFTESQGYYEITGMLGVFKGSNDASIVTSIVCEEGVSQISGQYADLNATTVDLPDGCGNISMYEIDGGAAQGVECANLYLRNTETVVSLEQNCIEMICVDCTEYDPEDPETCIDCAEEECSQYEYVYPYYTNVYVPSSKVIPYQSENWTNVSAIS